MSDPCLSYLPRESATPDDELVALAAVYAFIIQAHKRKEAAASAIGVEGSEPGGAATEPTSINTIERR
jgi:hypothetical protein